MSSKKRPAARGVDPAAANKTPASRTDQKNLGATGNSAEAKCLVTCLDAMKQVQNAEARERVWDYIEHAAVPGRQQQRAQLIERMNYLWQRFGPQAQTQTGRAGEAAAGGGESFIGTGEPRTIGAGGGR